MISVVSVDEAVIASLKVGDKEFEVLVDPDKALELRKGKSVNMEDLLAYPSIYRDARKALTASEEELQKAFGTTDVWKIAEKIVKNGRIQLTTEQRRRMIEEKKKEIANIIARRGINPQTNTPHPPQRILAVMEQAGVNIDPFEDAELQVDKVLKSIKALIPIKFQKIVVEVKVPPEYVGGVYNVLKEFTMLEQKWLSDGSLVAKVEMPAGVHDDFFAKVAKLTKGNFESKIVKREDV